LLHITQIRKLHGGVRIENVDDVIKVGDKIQVEIREVDDRGKLSLVPVEVVEREAAGEDLSGGRDERADRGEHRGDRGGDYRGDRDRSSGRDRGRGGDRGDRGRGGDRGSGGEHRSGGDHFRTRHRDRESGNS
jgi:polyribonucleotide nucleotidyltransferase